MGDQEMTERLVARGMAIVRPIIEREGRVVARAEELCRDMTGATTPLWQADMAEVDRRWWYRIARISLAQEGLVRDWDLGDIAAAIGVAVIAALCALCAALGFGLGWLIGRH